MSAVKLPNREVVNFQVAPALPEYISEILFEEIGGTELINMVRHDTVFGINVAYNIISNLTQINLRFDPSLSLSGVGTYDPIFSKFTIKFETKVPEGDFYLFTDDIIPVSFPASASPGGGIIESVDQPEDGELFNVANNVYINSNGDLVVELANILQDEGVEIEVRSDGLIYNVRENDNQ